MATYSLTTPLTSEDTKKLVAGDTVLLNGTIFTAEMRHTVDWLH